MFAPWAGYSAGAFHRVRLDGTLDLSGELLLSAELVGPLTGGALRQPVPVPLSVGGTLDHPRVEFDLDLRALAARGLECEVRAWLRGFLEARWVWTRTADSSSLSPARRVGAPRRMRFLLLTASILPALALAHGAFPQTLSVAPRPGNEQQLAVATTFGMLKSVDRGETWRWICEEAIGVASGQKFTTWFHPDGTLFVASARGLFISKDGGCAWTPVPDFAMVGAADVTALASRPDTLFVPTARYGVTNRVYRSVNGGQTFEPTPLASDRMFYTSVRIAPSDPNRVYAAGWWFDPTASSHFFRSDDGGDTFTAEDVSAKVPAPGAFTVHAVHPTQPDVVFASMSTASPPVENHLLRSGDGGKAFEKVLSTQEPFNSVALSDDGQTVWAATAAHLYRSTDGGKTFTELAVPAKNACVARSNNALYSCAWPILDGWALFRSEDGADTFCPAMHWNDIVGPLECPAGTSTGDTCPMLWPAQEATLPDDAPPADTCIVEAPDGGGDVKPPPRRCGCATGGDAWWWLVLLWRRRR